MSRAGHLILAVLTPWSVRSSHTPSRRFLVFPSSLLFDCYSRAFVIVICGWHHGEENRLTGNVARPEQKNETGCAKDMCPFGCKQHRSHAVCLYHVCPGEGARSLRPTALRIRCFSKRAAGDPPRSISHNAAQNGALSDSGEGAVVAGGRAILRASPDAGVRLPVELGLKLLRLRADECVCAFKRGVAGCGRR